MTVRFHLFPFRTQQLSSLVPKIVSWKRLVKIGSRRLLYGPLVKRLRQRPLTPLTSVRFRYGSPYAPLAQLVEQLTLNQWVEGSSPSGVTHRSAAIDDCRASFFRTPASSYRLHKGSPPYHKGGYAKQEKQSGTSTHTAQAGGRNFLQFRTA